MEKRFQKIGKMKKKALPCCQGATVRLKALQWLEQCVFCERRLVEAYPEDYARGDLFACLYPSPMRPMGDSCSGWHYQAKRRISKFSETSKKVDEQVAT